MWWSIIIAIVLTVLLIMNVRVVLRDLEASKDIDKDSLPRNYYGNMFGGILLMTIVYTVGIIAVFSINW